jgi:xanthine/uracil permease
MQSIFLAWADGNAIGNLHVALLPPICRHFCVVAIGLDLMPPAIDAATITDGRMY